MCNEKLVPRILKIIIHREKYMHTCEITTKTAFISTSVTFKNVYIATLNINSQIREYSKDGMMPKLTLCCFYGLIISTARSRQPTWNTTAKRSQTANLDQTWSWRQAPLPLCIAAWFGSTAQFGKTTSTQPTQADAPDAAISGTQRSAASTSSAACATEHAQLMVRAHSPSSSAKVRKTNLNDQKMELLVQKMSEHSH